MIKNKLARKVAGLTMIAAMMVGSSVSCFAATNVTGNTGTTPAHLNAPATPVNFSVTEKITLTGAANSVDLKGTDYVITNNAALGKISVDKIETKSADPYKVVAGTTDFLRLAKDTSQVAIIADATHDLVAPWASVGAIDPGANKTIKITGKTGIKTVAVKDAKVADVIATVSII